MRDVLASSINKSADLHHRYSQPREHGRASYELHQGIHEVEVKGREDGKRVPLGEGPLGGDGDLGLLARDGDGVAEVAGLSAGDLDALLQELLERGDVHDLVLHGLGAVDHERDRTLLLPAGRTALRRRRRAARHLPRLVLERAVCVAARVSGDERGERRGLVAYIYNPRGLFHSCMVSYFGWARPLTKKNIWACLRVAPLFLGRYIFF
jgi:hypothetical protein